MIRKIFGVSLLVFVLSLTGCASVPMANKDADAQAKTFAPAADQATLYIYRNEKMGSAVKMSVLVDGKDIGKTAAGTYIRQTLPAGTHVLVSKAENDASLDIDVKAGQTYFVWQEVKMGFVSARSALHLVDEQKGRAGVEQCSLVQSPLH